MQPTNKWTNPTVVGPYADGDWTANVIYNPQRDDMSFKIRLTGARAFPKLNVIYPKDLIEPINLGPLKEIL